MEWFERWFGEEYLLVYDHRDAEEAEREVATVCSVLELTGVDLVLDLCCGTGRHDLPLARRGLRIIGLDFSDSLLKIAESSRPEGQKYPLYVRADARDTVFREGAFDAVVNLFTSFGYFTDEENKSFIESIARLLRPGGRFYIDYLNPPRVLSELVPESSKRKNDIEIVERRLFNPETHRIEKTISLRDCKGDCEEFHESVHLYEIGEMRRMLNSAGLEVGGVLGSADGEPYEESSARMIIFGKKPM